MDARAPLLGPTPTTSIPVHSCPAARTSCSSWVSERPWPRCHDTTSRIRGRLQPNGVVGESHRPVEAKCARNLVATGAWLAAVESVSSGTTCCADSYFSPSPLLRRWRALESAVKSQHQLSNFPMPGPAARTTILKKASSSLNGLLLYRV